MLREDEAVRRSYLGTEAVADLMQQIVSGLASGGIYGSLALALVLIHRATGIINFAQGEMATFSTFILWTLTVNHGWPYWPAFLFTLAVSFGVGSASTSS